MQGTILDVAQPPHHARGVVVKVRFGQRRGVLLPGVAAGNANAIVERVLSDARLDVATRNHITRILTVTVQEWVRK